MKVTVCFDNIRVVVPCGDGTLLVKDLMREAILRYKKATGRNDAWLTINSLSSLTGGGLLDPDDRLCDVADDREQIVAHFVSGDSQLHVGGDGASSVGTNSPDFFHGDHHKEQHYVVNARAAQSSSSYIKRESAKRLSMHSLSTKEPSLLTPYSAQSLPRESRRKEPLGQDSKSYFDLASSKNDNYCFNGIGDADEIVIKNEAGPIGLHVVPCYDLLGNDQGLRVERIEPNGRIARDGQIELHDKIIKINGHNLLHVPFSKVQDIFMSAMNEPSLKILVMKNKKGTNKDKSSKNYNNNLRNNSKQEAEESLKKVQCSNYNILQTANTRKIGRMIEIELTKGTNGLGFSVTTRDNPAGGHCPIYIKNILPKGAAVEDGRLRPGDRLLEVNKMEMTGKNQAEVVSLLRSIPPGGKVKIVVSRQEEVSTGGTDQQLITSSVPRELTVSTHSTESNDNMKYWSTPNHSPLKKKEAEEPDKIEAAQHSYSKSNLKSPKHSDDVVLSPRKNRMILTLDIPVHDSEKAGLGVSVKGKTSSTDDNSSVDLGIFIKSVLHGGAASRDGRLRTNDQLLNVNGVSLLGLSNSDAMETLRRAMLNTNSPFTGVITLTIARRVSSYDGCEKSFSDSVTNSRSKTDLINRIYLNDSTSKQSDNRVREKNDLNSQSDAVDNGQLNSATSASSWNPVIDRLTEQYNKNSLRNESYCLATNKTWIDPGNKPQKLSIIHKEDSMESILVEETSQDRSQGKNDGKKHSEDKDSQYSEDPTYDSQLSLEELSSSGNKFSRDALGRQSMSEKRHAALDAKNTDTYKRNKKLREGREGKNVEQQNQHDSFEDPPTPKKVQSVEDFDKIRAKTISQESTFLEEQKNRHKKIIPDTAESDYLYTIPGRNKFISPRKHWLVDDVQGEISDANNAYRSEHEGFSNSRGDVKQASLNSALDDRYKRSRKKGGIRSMLRLACLLPTRQLLVQPKRFRGKINIQRPRPPHYERAKVLEFIKPIYFSAKRDKPIVELCEKVRRQSYLKKEAIVNPLQQIIAREALNWFNNSRMVAFFHLNPFSTEEKFNFAVTLKKSNMQFKHYGKDTMAMAVENTPYQPVLKLFTSHNLVVFGQEPNVGKLLKIIRKRPEIVLMAGIIDGKFLNKNDFVNYAKLGDLTAARSRLVQVLQNAGGVNLNRQLTQHQSTFVSRLEQISSPHETTEEKTE